MAHNVYQTALEENVRRVVCTSSNHATDYYERLILDRKHDFVYPDTMLLSDNHYGWAKRPTYLIAYPNEGHPHTTSEVGSSR